MTDPSPFSAPPSRSPHSYGAPGIAAPPAGAPAAGATAPGTPVPGTDLAADLGAALRFAGTALLRNPVAYLVVGVIYCAIYTVIIVGGMIGGFAAMFSRTDQWASSEYVPVVELIAFYAIMLGAMVLLIPFGLMWQSASGRAAEIVLEGGRPTISQALVGPWRIILTALLYGLIVMVGMLLFYIPGLIAAVLFMFAIPASARGAAPIAALKESYALVRANLGTAIVAYLVLSVILSVGAMVVVGVLVMTPFIVLFEVGMYERLRGRELPEPARA